MKWIKRTEQMPELKQDVILFIENEFFVGRLNFDEDFYINQNGKKIITKPLRKYFTTYEYGSCCLGDNPPLDKVTHWMHLPEKPK